MIVDAHLDLAYNYLKFERDLRYEVEEIRAKEEDRSPNGRCTVTIPELRKGKVGLTFGSIFVASLANKLVIPNPKTSFANYDEAHQMGMAQLDYYHRLADSGEGVRLITNSKELEQLLADNPEGGELVGIVPMMEGADPIRNPEEIELWYERGLRVVAMAWDDTRYAAGAWEGRDGLTDDGRSLLERMTPLGMILDLTHLSHKAAFEGLDRYEGPIISTHANPYKLVPHLGERHLLDKHIQLIAERGGVMGTVIYNRFLKEGHMKGDAKEQVKIADVVAQIDYICQLLGTAKHVGIGSDFDGGFGVADIPAEMDSVADLHLIGDALRDKGYETNDVAGIMGENWINFLRQSWK